SFLLIFLLCRRSCWRLGAAVAARQATTARAGLELAHGPTRPLDDLAVSRRRAGRVLLPALRAPDRRCGRARARRARGRRGAPLPVWLGGDHRARARAAGAGADDRTRRAPVLRHVDALPLARALGAAVRRVRPAR